MLMFDLEQMPMATYAFSLLLSFSQLTSHQRFSRITKLQMRLCFPLYMYPPSPNKNLHRIL
jgi:hypothetical protein